MITNNIADIEIPLQINNGGFGKTTANDSVQYATTLGLNSCKNLLIGSNFDANPWQRGYTWDTPSDNTWNADMWSYHYSGPATVRIDQGFDGPSVSQCGIFNDISHQTSVLDPESSIAPGSYYLHRTRVEQFNPNLIYKEMTLSFWVKSDFAGTYSVRVFQNPTGTQNFAYIAEYHVDRQFTWEFKTITIPAPNYNSHLYIDFVLGCGVNGQTANLNEWLDMDSIASIRQVNSMGGFNHFKLQFVQLESGPTFTGFEIRSPEEELRYCMRYCEKSYDHGTVPGTSNNSGVVFSPCAVTYNLIGTSKLILFKEQKPDEFNGTITLYDHLGDAGQWDFREQDNITITHAACTAALSSNGFRVITTAPTPTQSVGCYGHYIAKWEF